jgi:predicted lipid-binding transport protein (Tim44 family)
MVAWFLWSMWKRRSSQQAAFAGAGGPMMRDSNMNRSSGLGGGALGGGALGGLGLGGGSPLPGAAPSSAPTGGPANDEVGIGPQELETFERLLGEIQTAYGRQDLSALRARLTPEMLSYFSDELSANASRGIENQISNIKLEQGDLSEAWREGEMEYATVAMRYSLVDKVVDRNTGRVVDGGDAPVEATEVWTFVRSRGGNWLLGAIQQVD